MTIEDLDKKIIEILQRDSRTAYLDIAKKLSVSEGTIRYRVKSLIARGAIKKFSVILQNSVGAIIGIRVLPSANIKMLVKRMTTLGILQIYEVSGRFDIIAHIESDSLESVNKIIDDIRGSKEITDTETFTVLSDNSSSKK